MGKKPANLSNTEDFISKCKVRFGDLFDYSKVKYVNSQTPVTIICKEHGPFSKSPNAFLVSKFGCTKCGRISLRITQEELLNEFKNIHGDRYDYSLVNYVRRSEPIEIICRVHGSFFQKPILH
jgi:hypothetical protein